MTQSIAFINQKGGVGKTTLVANAGAWWGRQGHRVLLIDLDPQAHLTLHFHTGIDEEGRERNNIYRALRGECALRDAVQTLPDESISVIPSHIDLSAAEWELGQEVGREVILRDLLHAFLEEDPYDIILIDCPPSLGLLSLNALAAVDDVVVPVQAEFFALLGMAQLMRVIELVRSRLHPGLDWRVVVPTLVDLRTNLGRDVINELEGHVPGKVTKNWLMKRVKVAEAPSHGMSIFTYAGDTTAADEFRRVCDEIATRIGIEVREVIAKPTPEASEEADPVAEEADPVAEEAPLAAGSAPEIAGCVDEGGAAQVAKTEPAPTATVEGDAHEPTSTVEASDERSHETEHETGPSEEVVALKESAQVESGDGPSADSPSDAPPEGDLQQRGSTREETTPTERISSPESTATEASSADPHEPVPPPLAVEERAASIPAPTPTETKSAVSKSTVSKSTVSNSEEAKSEEAKSEEAKSEEAKSEEAKSGDVEGGVSDATPADDSVAAEESAAPEVDPATIPGSRIPAAAHPPAHRLPPERVLPDEDAPDPTSEEDPAERSARS